MNIQIGQKWLTVGGELVTVTRYDPTDPAPWVDQHNRRYYSNGGWSTRKRTVCDLDVLVHCPSWKQQEAQQ